MNAPVKNAVLVGLQLPKVSPAELESSLQELTRLVTTLGYKVVGQVTQKRSGDRSPSVMGKGKLQELGQWTGGTGEISSMVERKLNKATIKRLEAEQEELDEEEEDYEDSFEEGVTILDEDKRGSAQIVVVDHDLSPSQIRNLESVTGVTVFDRTGVIIEIFSRHARTRTARLQVEIARLTYLAPRLRETGGGEDRQGGGVGGKGSGESSQELDKRHIRDRIKELREEIESIGDEHQIRRTRREQEISVALVGYTNAGKSSLMRAMTGSEVLVADKLFATLDTTIRAMYPETRPKVLMSDTVGFIKKLPHGLVASFKSTLDEALSASLLLFVVDASDSAFRTQLDVTRNVLNEVGAQEIPSILILNKRDRLSDIQTAELKAEFPEAVMISTRDKDDLKTLRDRIMSYFESHMEDADVFVPYSAKGIIGEIRSKMRVLEETYNEEGVIFKVRSSPETLAPIKKKLATPNNN